MGNPIKPRKAYQGPSHPWQKARIDEERRLKQKYAYKNKKELWKFTSLLRDYRAQARSLIPLLDTTQGKREQKQLVEKLAGYGLVAKDATMDDILKLEIEDLLNRRLQTLVYRKGLANTVKQARQFIVHGHVKIEGNKITAPSYMVKVKEEETVILEPHVEEELKKQERVATKTEVEDAKAEGKIASNLEKTANRAERTGKTGNAKAGASSSTGNKNAGNSGNERASTKHKKE